VAADTKSEPGKRLMFEDFFVGQHFVSGTHLIDADQIKSFAGQFDPQPFHLDAEAAEASLFGELVASGWHTAAISMRLQVEGGLPVAGGIVGVGVEVTWPGPTRPGDILQVNSEIVELRRSKGRPDLGIVTVASDTVNQRGDVVQKLKARLMVPTRARV
jgi:acyl dehydratase